MRPANAAAAHALQQAKEGAAAEGAAIVEAEQFSRNAALYGEEGLAHIRGSYVALMLSDVFG